MSKGDNLIGIPTIYKGIQMRSKLESKVAMFLDALKISWEYEPKKFLLSDGTPYIPDFYLTELKIWIEVKGLILKHNKQISRKFCEENKQTLILISDHENIWFGDWMHEGREFFEDENIMLGKCSHCKSYFFCSNIGDWTCRKCWNHEGDHDLISSINSFGEWDIDFSDIDSIKRRLKKYGVRI